MIEKHEEVAADVARMEKLQRQDPRQKFHQVTTTDRAAYSSKARLASLKRITLSELRIDTIHRGCILVCRTIVKPFKLTAVLSLVEDPIVEESQETARMTESDVAVERLALYNFIVDLPGPRSDVSDRLPLGTRLFIKEPYYKLGGDGFPTLRCDNPADVVLVPNDQTEGQLLAGLRWSDTLPITYGPAIKREPESQSRSVSDLQHQGNQHFSRKDYTSAIISYTRALEREPKNIVILSNRAQAHLNLKQYRQALDDAEMALKLDKDHAKTRFRQAKALYGLRRYEEASVVLEGLAKDANNAEVEEVTRRTQERLAEQQLGRYKMTSILKEARSIHPPHLEHANYVRAVRVIEIPGKGRGLVATEDIPRGTLLLCSKAYAAVFLEELGVPQIQLSLDLSKREVSSLSSSHIVTKIAHKLQQEPWTAAELYDLHSGLAIPAPYIIPHTEDSTPQVDVERIANIVRLNAFNVGEARSESPAGTRVADVGHRLLRGMAIGTGLWILPSYINHSCVANALHMMVGDLMFVRTTRSISQGEEVTISYILGTDLYEDRKEKLQQRGVECQCELCEYEAAHSTTAREHRRQLCDEFEKLRPATKSGDLSVIPQLEIIISDLRKTYPPTNIVPSTKATVLHHHQLQLALINPLSALHVLRFLNGDFELAKDLLSELFEIQVWPEGRMEVAMALAKTYNELGEIADRDQWLDVSKNECEVVYGDYDGREIWEEEYKGELLDMQLR